MCMECMYCIYGLLQIQDGWRHGIDSTYKLNIRSQVDQIIAKRNEEKEGRK